jgi:hypothetical protein
MKTVSHPLHKKNTPQHFSVFARCLFPSLQPHDEQGLTFVAGCIGNKLQKQALSGSGCID